MSIVATDMGPTVAERESAGKEARQKAPRTSPADWKPAPDRFDPITLLEEQNAKREPDLVPVRHGRMSVSPFTFYRGAAKIQAADLARLPCAGLDAQLCGDAHLSNFGVFATPERNLVFDLNDFDETLPGPFEYDVARLTASFTIAARNNGHPDERAAALMAARTYRETMRQFSVMGTLAVWYAHLSVEEIMGQIRDSNAKGLPKDRTKQTEKFIEKARRRDSINALSKLAELVDGEYRIVSQPPVVMPLREFMDALKITADDVRRLIHGEFEAYKRSIDDDHRYLAEKFHILDAARKVVGVGSVGTRAFIILLQGRDSEDPLFLQIKEATKSVLEDHLPASKYPHSGQRVVEGQRMMQAASDIFLGWTDGLDTARHYYWRQLRDMKGSLTIETLAPEGLVLYARLCGWTLARAHARSGDSVAIASYLGKGDVFERAFADFAVHYADQNERDYQAMLAAIKSGRIPAISDI